MSLVPMRPQSMRARHGVHPFSMLAVVALTGCSVINDTTAKQCQSDDQCAERFGTDLAISCVESYCSRTVCATDAECTSRGPRYADSVCVEGFCGAQPGAATAISCVQASDCNSQSPTMQCVAGRCEDKTWGCRGQLDERGEVMSPTATIETQVYDLTTRQPVPSITARACLLPTFDPECTRPLPGAMSSYDRTTGRLTVSGLPHDTQIRLKIDFPPESGLIPLDIYSARTPHDLTRIPLLTTMPAVLATTLTAALDPPPAFEPDGASVSAIILDCQNQPATGVSVRVAEADRLPSTQVLYFGSDGQVAPRASATEAFGSALVINAKAGKLITLQTWAGPLLLNEYRVMPFPRRSTAVHFFPRIYPDRTAGGGL